MTPQDRHVQIPGKVIKQSEAEAAGYKPCADNVWRLPEPEGGSESDILTVAKQCARLGWRLHPTHAYGPKAKQPRVNAWQIAADKDPKKLDNWYESFKGEPSGVAFGVACGPTSGVFVVDVDLDGQPTNPNWEALVAENPPLPKTAEARTGSGGTHYYFKYPANRDIRNSRSKLAKKVDVRGDGGHIVLPPSPHPSGTRYEWVNAPWDVPPAFAPEWLLELAVKASGKKLWADLDEVWEPGTQEETINHYAFVAGLNGEPQEAITATLLEKLKSGGIPSEAGNSKGPWTEAQVKEKAEAGWAAGHAEAGKSPLSEELQLGPKGVLERWGKPESVADVMASEDPPEVYIIEKLFKRGELVMMSGRAGKGKTWTLLTIGLFVAAGLPIPCDWTVEFGEKSGLVAGPRRTFQMVVLYVNVDTQGSRLRRRVKAIIRASGLPESTPFHLWSPMSPHLEVTAGNHTAALTQEIERLRQGGPILVIFDAMTGMTTKLDQYLPEIRKVPDFLLMLTQKHDATVILGHHHNKGDDKYRGSPVIEERVNTTFTVDSQRLKPNLLRVTVKEGEKQHGEMPANLTLEYLFNNEDVPVDQGVPDGMTERMLMGVKVSEVDPGDGKRVADMNVKVLVKRALQDSAKGLGTNALTDLVPKKRETVIAAMNSLLDEGVVSRKDGSRGGYIWTLVGKDGVE